MSRYFQIVPTLTESGFRQGNQWLTPNFESSDLMILNKVALSVYPVIT